MKTQQIDIPLQLPDQDGQDCAGLLLSAVSTQRGITGAEFDPGHSTLRLSYDPDRVSMETVAALGARLGVALGRQFDRCTLGVGGLRCDQCALRLEREVGALPGVVRASLNPAAATLGVEYDTAAVSTAQIEQHIQGQGYRVGKEEEETFWDRHGLAVMTVFSLVFLLAGLAAHWLGAPRQTEIVLFALSYVAGGWFAVPQGIRALLSLSLDVDFLMVAAALGAAAINHWEEGAILLFLFSLGTALEHYALDRTRHAIRALMDLSPQEATVIRVEDGVRREQVVPVEELRVGDMVLVRSGEKIAADGQIVTGQSAVDQAAITGESIPVDKAVGDPVFAGTLNGSGALEIRVTKRAQDTTLAKIVQMVEEARSEKSPTQRFIETFEEKYAWGVVGITALLAILPPLFGQPFETSFYRAMTLLVVASPCALVISTPASILSAIANGARAGVLFKGGAHLENTAGIQVVAFDKTGTLTYGKPKVTDVLTLPGVDETQMLSLAAAVESLSEHPIAHAVVVEAQTRELTLPLARDGQSVTGQGIYGKVDGATVWVGKPALAEVCGVRVDPTVVAQMADLESHGKTVMIVGTTQPLGLIAVADTMRPQAAETVAALKRLGIKKVVMLTGDNRRAAEAMAQQTGVDEMHAELLPADKVRLVKELAKQYGTVALIGDGVNDAPALAAATVGIAMGAAGTDVALETADVVLMGDDLTRLPYAIALGRQATRVVKQNLTFALGVIVTLILSTFVGVLPLTLGVFGHEGSTVIVCLNGLRLLGFRPRT